MKHVLAVFSLVAMLAVGSQVLSHTNTSAAEPDKLELAGVSSDCACPAGSTVVMEADEPTLGERVMNELSPISTAHAADVWVSALTSTDAGATNTYTMTGKSTYKLKCKNAACHSFGTTSSAPAPDCTKDSMLAQVTTGLTGGVPPLINYVQEFENGGYTKVAARAPDAGNPDCSLFIVIKNP